MVNADEKIAIIGMGCRLPGDAASLESFWELLIQGRDSWSEVPPERWNASAYYHSSGERKGTVSRNMGKVTAKTYKIQTSIKGAHFLTSNIARFDAPFFAITPSEAKTMDPQQRILLEVTYEAFENGEFVAVTGYSATQSGFTDNTCLSRNPYGRPGWKQDLMLRGRFFIPRL